MAEHTISDSDFRLFVRLQDLASKYDGVDGLAKKITKLEEDNGKLREDKRKFEEAAKAVPEGAVVLTGDDAAKWAKVKEVDVDDLTAKATKTAELEAEIAKRDKSETRRKAAEAERYDVTVLESIAGADALEYEVGEVADPKDASKKVPAGFVVVDSKKVRLSEYAKEKFPAPIVEALAASGGGTNGKAAGGHIASTERVAGGGDKAAGKGVDAQIEAMRTAAKAPNPLRPAKAT